MTRKKYVWIVEEAIGDGLGHYCPWRLYICNASIYGARTKKQAEEFAADMRCQRTKTKFRVRKYVRAEK